MFPFEGMFVHEVLAGVIAYRIGKITRISFSISINDYGFELLSEESVPLEEALELDLFSEEDLMEDIGHAINKTELATRKFRDVATIAGLIFPGYPGKNIRAKHLQASTSILYKVFDEYDKSINKYGVKVGTTLKFWESKNWIKKIHPYGWVQWYCDFFMGKRSEDDERQIKRWKGVAGERGRFMRFLVTQILKKKKTWNDETVSPKIRQTLQHWAYKLTKKDFDYEVKRRKNK